MSMTLIACGESDGGSDTESLVNQVVGQYQAEISDSGGLIRAFTVTISIGSDGSYRIIEDGAFVVYTGLRRSVGSNINHFLENDSSEAVQLIHSSEDSISECLTSTSTGSNSSNSVRLSISSPKFAGGGPGTSLVACRLKD